MGCCNSTDGAEEPVNNKPVPVYTEPERVSASLFSQAHDRLKRLRELDDQTKVPFILVELTGEGDGLGEIEVCGKDEYGIYEALDEYFKIEWGCEQMDPGDDTEDTKIPFCSAQYRWPGYHTAGEEGMSNMGMCVMRLIDFVCSKQSWTLACINGGNVGKFGEVRETQIVFKAPHPMNLVAPHLMVELRSAGYIEVCADLEEKDRYILEKLDNFFTDRFQAERVLEHEEFCDLYYKAGEGVFNGDFGASLDSNFGLLVTDVCDKIAGIKGWSLVAANGGNYGENSENMEEQLVFRRDEHPLGDAKYLMMVINEKGNIEVNGKQQRGLYGKLDNYLCKKWGCKRMGQLEENGTKSRRYGWEDPETIPDFAKDLVQAAGLVVKFFELQGWEIQVCSQYLVKELGEYCREQQLLFRPGKTEVGTIEPHLLVELYSGEGAEDLYKDPEEPTQVLANQHIRVITIGPNDGDGAEAVNTASGEIRTFLTDYLGGEEDPSVPGKYHCNVFLCRGMYENNMAQWTMRVCDYIVDRLGWTFLQCTLCNSGEFGQFRGQQLAFRWECEIKAVPLARRNQQHVNASFDYGLFQTLRKPEHWNNDLPMQLGDKIHNVINCDEEELEALQVMLDSTYKRVLTRDRKPDEDAPEDEEMPYRLEVVNAFRSEHAYLHYRVTKKAETAANSGVELRPFEVKTADEPTILHERLGPGESYLFHGSNPSSAMSILNTGFNVNHAGSTTGTMFGNGIYTAECASKADEYGRDDGGGTYPGLLAMLVCKCYVGNTHVITKPGDGVSEAKERGLDTVVGDRESRVGTYREFIFPEEEQVYPEFSIIYRRVWDKEQIPEDKQHMIQPTTGTTGRYWQVQQTTGAGGWKNLPSEVNKLLVAAQRRGENEVSLNFNGSDYRFLLAEKTARNETSGKNSKLRAPMGERPPAPPP